MENPAFFNLDNPVGGIKRKLAEGVDADIFVGDGAMLSVVVIAPNAKGSIHSHPEEQWGVLLDGSAIRIQDGQEHPVEKGDFWRTPGEVEHGVIAGPNGAKILDIFSPPREEYRNSGEGFGD